VIRALRYDWPGNVRELANFARELVFSSRGQAVLRIGRTFDALLPAKEAGREAKAQAPAVAPADRQAIGDELLVETLRRNRWQVGATARALGIAKNTLYQLMERCEGIRKARDLGREEILECRESSGGDQKLMAERLEVSERGLKLRMRELDID
jgi:DNA-binding NtrC family response regulator